MKVLFFSRDYSPHDHRFLTALAESGQDVHYLRLEKKRKLDPRTLPERVKLVEWPHGGKGFDWKRLPDRIRMLGDILDAVRPDVVHAGPIQTCAFIAASAGARPLVSMSWGSDMLVEAKSNPGMELLTSVTLQKSDHFLSDNDAVTAEAVRFGFPVERITQFPWGIDLRTFTPAKRGDGRPETGEEREASGQQRTALGWDGRFVALSLRSWEPIYGVDVVVKGFAKAVAANPQLRLLLLGGGSLEGQIRGLIDELGLTDRVHLAGTVANDELVSYYHAADLYLSASHSDGSSVSLLEAMGCGLPALVSDIPGNRQWVTPGENGWRFPDGDADALAERLLAAAAGPGDALREMGRQGRKLVEERADWHANVKKLNLAYQVAKLYHTRRGIK